MKNVRIAEPNKEPEKKNDSSSSQAITLLDAKYQYVGEITLKNIDI